ncbi:hypothetical protein BRC89_01210 [Halobacteriales archaeon QS_4_70_19]|nr:MAG: hypothetical protein BRC89_01210 [Halobacteriales archaeon QS_4_70_19]
MESHTLHLGLRVEAVVAATGGTGLIILGGPALTALGVVLGLVSLVPVVGLSIEEWQPERRPAEPIGRIRRGVAATVTGAGTRRCWLP